jgi:propionyl-CoA carboxylase beta chain
MVDQTSQMLITGPDVIKTVTGEDLTMEELGGAHTHMAKSCTAHYVASGEQDAFEYVRDLLSYLPLNNYADPLRYPVPVPEGAIEDNLTDEDLELDTLIPDSPNQPYDMHEVVTRILDDEFLKVQAGYATNVWLRPHRGRPVGIVANQPTHFAACLDINGSEKAARFVGT